jgi:hypothetical protein
LLAGMSHNLWHILECTVVVSCNKGTVRNSDQREGRVEVERELDIYCRYG